MATHSVQRMVARRIATKEQVNCASADYLAQHGTPKTLEALRGHRAVNYFTVAGARHASQQRT